MRTILGLVIGLLAVTTGLFAENTGTLAGTVTTEKDSIIADALIEVFVGMEVFTSGYSDSEGIFTFNGLEPGVYDLRVKADGYSNRLYKGAKIVAGETDSVHVVLRVEGKKRLPRVHLDGEDGEQNRLGTGTSQTSVWKE
jgi:hypothetical protein